MYDSEIPFNMSIKTLERIHELLMDCALYSVNVDVLGYKKNLYELYKETNPHLNKDEKKKAGEKWDKIEEFGINITEEVIEFDKELIILLNKFDFWLRGKLHDHRLTFSKSDATHKGLDSQRKKYDIKNDD